MYDRGQSTNFLDTPMAYRPKEAPMEVKSEAGIKGKMQPYKERYKRRRRTRSSKLLPGSAPPDLDLEFSRKFYEC
jgi:hypothetical protein